MKDLITSIAAVTVLMVFVMQFATNQVTSAKILAADRAVENYITVLRNGEGDDGKLKGRLAEVLKCKEDEVSVSSEKNFDKITVDVKAPLKNVIACSNFLGISEDENAAFYRTSFEVQP